MSVMVYSNGAWQEATETPKKYVNGAWEDTDGYAYEGGAWVEKWSAKPKPIYLIKDGVRQSGFTFTTSNYSGSGSSSYYYCTNWKQNGSYQYATATTTKGDHCGQRLTIAGSAKIPIGMKLYLDGYYTFSNSASDSDASSTANIMIYNLFSSAGSVYANKSSRKTVSSTATVSSNPSSWSVTCNVYSVAFASKNQRSTTFYIYNLWFE